MSGIINWDSISSKLLGKKTDFGINERFFHLACLQVVALLLLSSVIDYANWGFQQGLLCFTGALLFFLTYYLGRFKRLYNLSFWFFTILLLVFCNASWFFYSGSYGPTIYFFFIVLSFFVFYTEGIKRRIIMAFIIWNILGLMFFEYNSGDKLNQYVDNNARLIDLTVTFLYIFAMISSIILYAKEIYNEQRKLTEETLRLLEEDIEKRKEAEIIIEKSLKEKEILIKEVHHRVKNNLQIISSLLNLQIRYLKDKDGEWILREAQSRVQSMALIHQKLYQTEDFSSLDMHIYISDLLHNYKSSLPDASMIHFEKKLEHINMDIDRAIVCGLIINELVTNAIKYAFPDKKGTISIELFKNIETNKTILKISDDGIGLQKNINIEQAETLGLNIVNRLIKSIEGEISVSVSEGTHYLLTF